MFNFILFCCLGPQVQRIPIVRWLVDLFKSPLQRPEKIKNFLHGRPFTTFAGPRLRKSRPIQLKAWGPLVPDWMETLRSKIHHRLRNPDRKVAGSTASIENPWTIGKRRMKFLYNYDIIKLQTADTDSFAWNEAAITGYNKGCWHCRSK